MFMRLSIYEHALRNRVSLLLDLHLGEAWWTQPTNYMRAVDATAVHKENRLVSEFKEAGVEKIREFKASALFVANLHLPELHAIVRHMWTPLFRFLFNPHRMAAWDWRQFVQATKDLEVLRRNVMHAKPSHVTPSNRVAYVRRLNRLLAATEFDVEKTITAIHATKFD